MRAARCTQKSISAPKFATCTHMYALTEKSSTRMDLSIWVGVMPRYQPSTRTSLRAVLNRVRSGK